MSLREIQARMAAAVMQPLTPSERMRPKTATGKSMRKEAAEFIKPNDRLTSFERLEIYNRQYWWRVLGSLMEDFPGLQAVVGERKFDALSKAYLIDCPSRSFTLRNLGSRLEEWLKKHPKYTAPHETLALDVVRLEWAQIDAFDAAEEPRMRSEDLQALGPDPCLRVQPYLRLLDLSYPVDDLLLAIKDAEGDEDRSMASNAMNERRRHSHIRRFKRLQPQKIFLLVHRLEDSIYFKRLEPEAFALLHALKAGKPFSRAATLAFRGSAIPKEAHPETVKRWFEDWSSFGWFCRPASGGQKQNPRRKPVPAARG